MGYSCAPDWMGPSHHRTLMPTSCGPRPAALKKVTSAASSSASASTPSTPMMSRFHCLGCKAAFSEQRCIERPDARIGWQCMMSRAEHCLYQWTRRLPLVARSYRQHCPICSRDVNTLNARSPCTTRRRLATSDQLVIVSAQPTCDHFAGSGSVFPFCSARRARLGVSSGRRATLRPPLSCSSACRSCEAVQMPEALQQPSTVQCHEPQQSACYQLGVGFGPGTLVVHAEDHANCSPRSCTAGPRSPRRPSG